MMFEPLAGSLTSAGVDEAGRGPLAGPVVAAAVVLAPCRTPEGLRDSKRLTQTQRERLALEIRRVAIAWAIGRADVEEIDALNILRATHLAMQRAIASLDPQPELVLVDGNRLPMLAMPALAIVGGDDRVPAISAASILAKVARDEEMTRLARRFPGYGLERHKGYGTKAHLDALHRLGPSPLHRHSFAPVRECARVPESARVPTSACPTDGLDRPTVGTEIA